MNLSNDLAQLYLASNVTVRDKNHWVSASLYSSQINAPIHVITAWNPGDKRLTTAENNLRNEELRVAIEEIGHSVVPARGSDPNSKYYEASWAARGLTDELAIELGRKFDQVAVFKITSDSQTVLGCFKPWIVSRQLHR